VSQIIFHYRSTNLKNLEAQPSQELADSLARIDANGLNDTDRNPHDKVSDSLQ
jgi:hypothetical protein